MIARKSDLRPLACFLMILLPSACGSTKTLRVDDSLLVDVPEERLERVQEARLARDRAGDAVAASQREAKTAEKRVKLARATLETNRSRLSQCKLEISVASSEGTSTDVQQAQQSLNLAAAEVGVAEAELELRKREAEHARLAHKLARERLGLANAEVELVKARAVQGVNRAAAVGISEADFEKQFVKHRKGVEQAEKRCTTALSRVADSRKALEAASSKASGLRSHAPGSAGDSE